MRSKHFSWLTFLSLLLILLFATGLAQAPISAPAGPPKTEVNEVKEMVQGVEIIDPYRWLEDQNSSQTRAWIEAQNSYTESLLAKVPGRDELKEKISKFLKIDAMGTPIARNGRYFFTKRAADQDQSQLFMRKGLTGTDELLVDPLAMNPQHTTTVGFADVLPDGSLIAYGVRQGGEDETVPHMLDVDTRKELADKFPRARYSGFQVMPDRSGVYYSRLMPEGPRVFFHKMGADVASDTEIFGKGYGQDKSIGVGMSDDGHYLEVIVYYGSAATKTEVYVQDLVKKGPLVTIVNDVDAAFYAHFAGDKLYLQTNWKAPKWRVLEVDLKNPARDKWRELVPESDAVLDNVTFVGGKMALLTKKNVISSLKLYDIQGKFIREVPAPTLGTLSGLGGSWENQEAFYTFSSFHVPATSYRYDLATGKQTIWHQAKMPIQTDQYEVKQVWYPSKDGTKIPMFIAHAKGLKLDGTNPTLLYAYGGFNLSQNPTFSSLAAVWMSYGGVYAVANLRGGGEFGEDWHHGGMLEKKQNVFDDFTSAAEWLIQNKYTRPDKLAIRGGSNGGLLVGAAVTQRPELYGAVICNFPLLDMVRYHQFLVAKLWVPEYGSSEDPKQFKYIYAYSPYHHVKAGTKYPSVMFITGDSDTRVAPLHARKMAALMQASTGSDNPILLHYDTKAGHSGGTPVSKSIVDLADELSFLMWRLNMTKAPSQMAAAK